MIFLFGSSRSWAAREARRKARQMALRKRRVFIKRTAGVFSFAVLSTSLFLMMHTRRIEGKTTGTKMIHQESESMSDVSVKTADTMNTSTLEMPRPPLEPSLPTGNTETGPKSNLGVKGSGQGVDTDSNARPEVRLSTMASVETGEGGFQASQADSAQDRHVFEDDRQRGSSVRRGDAVSSGGTAVHGLTYEVSGGGGSPHDDVNKLSEHTNRDLQGSEVQKRQIHDVLGAEEGGEGLTINLPTHESSSGNSNGGGVKNSFGRVANGREEVRKEVEANLRQLYRDEPIMRYTGITSGRERNSGYQFGHGKQMDGWHEKGRNGDDMMREASSRHDVGSVGYNSPPVKRMDVSARKDTIGDEVISQRGAIRVLQIGNVEKVREAKKRSGNYDEGMDVRDGGVVGETRDYVTNVYSKDSAVDTRYHVSSNAAGSGRDVSLM